MEDVALLRQKIDSAGWKIREFPIKANDVVRKWKIVAIKGDKTISLDAPSLDQALLKMAKLLGIVSQSMQIS